MLNHLCSPQMSDLIVRLLNFNKNVLQKNNPDVSDLSDQVDKTSED